MKYIGIIYAIFVNNNYVKRLTQQKNNDTMNDVFKKKQPFLTLRQCLVGYVILY